MTRISSICSVSSGKVLEFARGVTEEQYLSDIAKRRSVERSLELIEEAARRISKPFREEHPEIPWKDIIGQRSVLAHDYGDISDIRVWDTVIELVPSLLRALESLVPPEEKP
ncbi:MAG TPA: HepT-like ribonuclease domain-containing protein [Thermoanaerobaculia bacterium]